MFIFPSILFTSLAVWKTFPTEEFWLAGIKKYWKTSEEETENIVIISINKRLTILCVMQQTTSNNQLGLNCGVFLYSIS